MEESEPVTHCDRLVDWRVLAPRMCAEGVASAGRFSAVGTRPRMPVTPLSELWVARGETQW